ncbi:hypothetical protein ES703_07512 [subsurface metagenome]
MVLGSTLVTVNNYSIEATAYFISDKGNFRKASWSIISAFSKKVSIEISSIREENINLKVFNISGRKIKDIFTGKLIGKKLLIWDVLDEKGNFVSSGIYFVRLRSGDFASVKKIILVR